MNWLVILLHLRVAPSPSELTRLEMALTINQGSRRQELLKGCVEPSGLDKQDVCLADQY